ncbi:hypothetical protein [Cohnella boryungensis]|uniref:Uncharacterized protein n=1 Tax=Cohnella boryungensis TaxID=768479 RepID=A0ABV8SI93_9BACL
MYVRIKGLEGELISIQVIGYSYPHSDEYWDANWLTCDVNAKIPGFVAQFSASLRTEELTSFYYDLIEMYDRMTGSSSMVGLESNVDIKVRMDKLGKLEWQVKLMYPVGNGATLEFEFSSDQSYMVELIDELKAINMHFPIKRTTFDRRSELCIKNL